MVRRCQAAGRTKVGTLLGEAIARGQLHGFHGAGTARGRAALSTYRAPYVQLAAYVATVLLLPLARHTPCVSGQVCAAGTCQAPPIGRRPPT